MNWVTWLLVVVLVELVFGWLAAQCMAVGRGQEEDI